jgi:hypothetical protein
MPSQLPFFCQNFFIVVQLYNHIFLRIHTTTIVTNTILKNYWLIRLATAVHSLEMVIYTFIVPFARHYKPRLVFFFTHFSLRLRLILQGGLYLWILFFQVE